MPLPPETYTALQRLFMNITRHIQTEAELQAFLALKPFTRDGIIFDWHSLPDLAGDVTGRPNTNTVIKLRGRLLATATPDTGDVLVWSGTEWVPEAETQPLIIRELDGSPSGTPTSLKFPNGTLTDNGDGTYTYTPTPGITDHGALSGLGDDDHPQYTTNLEATAIADASVATHAGLSDPHTVYQKESEKGATNGYASLGADTLVPQDQLGTGVQDGTRFLRDDGTWQEVAAAASGYYAQYVWASNAPAPFDFVTDEDGEPIFSLEALE